MAGSTSRTSSGCSTTSDLFVTGMGRPVLPGCTAQLEYVDVPGHIDDLVRHRARVCAMAGNRCAIVADHPDDLVEVRPPAMGQSTAFPERPIRAHCRSGPEGHPAWVLRMVLSGGTAPSHTARGEGRLAPSAPISFLSGSLVPSPSRIVSASPRSSPALDRSPPHRRSQPIPGDQARPAEQDAVVHDPPVSRLDPRV